MKVKPVKLLRNSALTWYPAISAAERESLQEFIELFGTYIFTFSFKSVFCGLKLQQFWSIA